MQRTAEIAACKFHLKREHFRNTGTSIKVAAGWAPSFVLGSSVGLPDNNLPPLHGWTAESGCPHMSVAWHMPLRPRHQRLTANSGSGLAEGYALAFAFVESKTFWLAK